MTTNHGPDQEPFRIVVAVGAPAHLTALLALAVPLARTQAGEVLPLYVSATGERPAWLRAPDDARDVVRPPLVITGRQAGAAILNVVRELSPDLLLVMWRGSPSRGRYLLGSTLDPLIQYAPCNVAVLRLSRSGQGASESSAATSAADSAAADAFAARMAGPESVLVPTGGGPNAALAIRIALELGSDTRITALRVANTNLGPTAVSAEWDSVNESLGRWSAVDRVHPRVILAPSPIEGIVREAREGYDLVLVGATRESLVDRLLFGNLPQALARELDVPLLIVRRYDPRTMGALLRARWRLINILPQLSLEERITVYRQVRRNVRINTDFYVMMTLASAMASLGLLLDSPTVVIGAMLMSPLMSTLLGLGLGVVQGDIRLLRLASRTLLLGVLTVLAVSALTAFIVPGNRITAEMLGSSTPTLGDLVVALMAGGGAAYAISRKDVSAALPGVAMGVTLVPPVATAGLTALSGNVQVATGAALLFLANLAAIVAGAAVVLLWMGFHPDAQERRRARTFRGGALATATLLAGVAIVLGVLTAESVRDAALRERIDRSLGAQLSRLEADVALVDWRMHHTPDDAYEVEVTIQATRGISPGEAAGIQERLTAELQRPISISMTVLPATRLEAVTPAEASPAVQEPSVQPLAPSAGGSQ